MKATQSQEQHEEHMFHLVRAFDRWCDEHGMYMGSMLINTLIELDLNRLFLLKCVENYQDDSGGDRSVELIHMSDPIPNDVNYHDVLLKDFRREALKKISLYDLLEEDHNRIFYVRLHFPLNMDGEDRWKCVTVARGGDFNNTPFESDEDICNDYGPYVRL